MKRALRTLCALLGLLLVFFAGSVWSRNQSEQSDAEALPVPYAWDHQLAVYYPAQKKLYVYTALGGNCVFAYTLTYPGGPVKRENCK